MAFKQPIEYVEEQHFLSEIVQSDLELTTTTTTNKTMVEQLTQPTNYYAREQSTILSKLFTTNTIYLEETQTLIQEFDDSLWSNQVDMDIIHNIWTDFQSDKDFKQRHGFIEWDILDHLNTNPLFLQWYTILQFVSPILSILMPFFILFFPFLLILIQGHSISIETYIGILHSIAKSHFVGKLFSLRTLTSQEFVYFLISVFFYIVSTYQNITSTIRLYHTIIKMNQNLLKLKQYIEDILPKMDYYLNIIREKKTYELFYRDLFETRTKLETIYDQHFNTIPSYVESSNLYYMKGVGSMLQLYYQLFTQDTVSYTHLTLPTNREV